MNITRLLVLLTLVVSCVYSFSWDIVVGTGKRLEFYYNETLTHTEDIPSAKNINSVTYDPVHYRVLFAGFDVNSKLSISSFDLLTRKIQPFVTRESNKNTVRHTYDPVTQLLFWKQKPSIYSFSLDPAASNNALDENTLINLGHDVCWDIAVDSCGGHIYWATKDKIERTLYDGSKREVLINSTVEDRLSLAIDQQTQKLYWIDRISKNDEYYLYIESADFNGKNRNTLYERNITATLVSSLAISKDFIYWRVLDQNEIWKLPKNPGPREEPKSFPISISDNSDFNYHIVAANYTIDAQIEGNPNCKSLKSLITKPIDSDNSTQGYTGDKCDVSSCHNYCFQGYCSVSAEGPKCRCNAGYSGERCEVSVCYKYCLNKGFCSLNEQGEPVCKCSADYEGKRCEVATTHTDDHNDSTTQYILREVRQELRQLIQQGIQQAIQQELQRVMQCYSDKIKE